ncbi:MFS transporter [Gorillibacterium timonense]|uniref:MFS transporter n=1 Tax=Gorillibacterium timonense TaxID=1689269 RepID=UPI00071E052F|nr:MFS transporter [Gorillibacterium timonense]
MKTAVWLYLFLFVAMFDLHAQYPILSPFALSLGAVPSFIGLIMGMYSVTHLPGNLIAGYGVDRFGSKRFICASLMAGGFLLILQAGVDNPWELLVIRSLSGFALAFLSPASMAMLARLARSKVQQSRLMAGNGLVHTLASVVSPAAGALLVHKLGFSQSFLALGILLMLTGLITLFALKEDHQPETPAAAVPPRSIPSHSADGHGKTQRSGLASQGLDDIPIPWFFYGIPIGLSCAQGILFFELPLGSAARSSIMTTGLLFTMVSIGALFSLSLLFLNRFSAFGRTLFGSLVLAVIYYGMAVGWNVPLPVTLFLIGAAKGMIFPSIAALLAEMTPAGKYGRAFSILSISFSIGSFLGPILAGQLRTEVSPYFLAFAALMTGLILMPLGRMRRSIPT